MATENIYGVVVFEDLLTKRKISNWTAQHMRRLHEDIEMYKRNTDGNISFSFETIGNYEQTLSRFTCVECDYRRNPFDVALKSRSHDITIIPKVPKDPRDSPWVLLYDNEQKEVGWVNDILNRIGDRLYKQCCDENSKDFIIFGSLCHRGMINHVFDYHHENIQKMEIFRKWIDQLGPVFHREILSSFRMSYDKSIYVNNMFCSHVTKFCIYCETMFDISRYEVAKLFVKRLPEEFINKGDNVVSKAHNNNHAAAIYAETGDYETALKYYQHSVELLKDERCQVNYQHKVDEFIEYYRQNGTSILSSKY